MLRKQKVLECFIDDYDEANAYISKNFFEGKSSSFRLRDSSGRIIPLSLIEVSDQGTHNQYKLKISSPIDIREKYEFLEDHHQPVPAVLSHIVKTVRFQNENTPEAETFGIHYTPEKTVFTLWAPTAHSLKVRLFEKDGERIIDMHPETSGTWKAEVEGDLRHTPYTYLIERNGELVETVDPNNPFLQANTSRSVVNSIRVLDLPEKVEMEPMESPVDAIIYEASIRDMTSQLSLDIDHPSRFRGFTEETDETRNRKKGFSYLKDLGITHVQLMPVLDFGSTDELNPKLYYNWGYDPAHFRALEGSYVTDPNNEELRVTEFANLVHDLHEAGIRVILDVVFNHVYNKDHFSLDKIVPDYYFLMNRQGEYSNGSFCGNDIDSRPKMAARYLINTCRYLAYVYDIDGLRFDLMGILDVDLMNQIQKEVSEIKPGFMIYGEGWNMPSYVPEDLRASMNNMGKMPKIGHFSDRFRETVKGSNGDLRQKGFSGGDTGRIGDAKAVMAASVTEGKFDSPEKVVNYVECHDNHTLWDKLSDSAAELDTEQRKKLDILAGAMVLMAQGIPFLHSGQEFGRTKHGLGNTYNRDDSINMIDYYRKDANQDMVDQYKKLISIRKSHPALRLRTADEIREKVKTYDLDGKILVVQSETDDDGVLSIFNPTGFSRSWELPGEWTVEFDNGNRNQGTVSQVQIEPYSTIILTRFRNE